MYVCRYYNSHMYMFEIFSAVLVSMSVYFGIISVNVDHFLRKLSNDLVSSII